MIHLHCNSAKESSRDSLFEEHCDGSLNAALCHIHKAQSDSIVMKQILEKERKDHNETRAALIECEVRCKAGRDLFVNYSEEAMKNMKKLKTENVELRIKQKKSIKYRLERVHELNTDELNTLNDDLNEGLSIIQKERDTRSKCVICLDKPKNVYFVDGCDCVVICSKCEKEMTHRCCPVCNISYSKTKTLRI